MSGSVSFSPDGQTLASGSGSRLTERALSVYGMLAQGIIVRTLTRAYGFGHYSVSFSPDGQHARKREYGAARSVYGMLALAMLSARSRGIRVLS